MRKNNIFLAAVLIFVSLLNTSCERQRMVKEAAKDFCECLKDLAKMNQRLGAFSKAQAVDSVTALIPEAQVLRQEAEICMMNKEAKYGDVARDAAFKTSAMEAIARECPDVYSFLPAEQE